MRSFRHCTAADLDTAARVLATAFVDDPVFGWIYPDRAARPDLLVEWMVLEIGFAHRRGHTYLAHDATAATVWAPPDVSLDDEETGQAMAGLLARQLGPDAATRLAGGGGIAEMHPREPHFYLRLVGVHPDRQGQGVGREMLAPILELCDAEDLPAYLENSNPRNEPFYRSLGFGEVGRARLGDGPELQGMWRPPGAATT